MQTEALLLEYQNVEFTEKMLIEFIIMKNEYYIMNGTKHVTVKNKPFPRDLRKIESGKWVYE